MVWWHEVDWRAFATYSVTGGPATALGARTLLVLPLHGAVTFQQPGALPAPVALQGQTVGSSVMAGSFAGKLVAWRMSVHVFQHLLAGLLFCSGLALSLGRRLAKRLTPLRHHFIGASAAAFLAAVDRSRRE